MGNIAESVAGRKKKPGRPEPDSHEEGRRSDVRWLMEACTVFEDALFLFPVKLVRLGAKTP
jgi:hypothetical protein